jgi:hypothetical protein
VGREGFNRAVERGVRDFALEAELAVDVPVDAEVLAVGIADEIPSERGARGEHWDWASLSRWRVERGSGLFFFENLALTSEL